MVVYDIEIEISALSAAAYWKELVMAVSIFIFNCLEHCASYLKRKNR